MIFPKVSKLITASFGAFVDFDILIFVCFKAVIEATRGLSYLGDIAVDDISLTTTKCVQPSSTCTFENNQCGYIDDTSSDVQFQWKRQSLSTSSTGSFSFYCLRHSSEVICTAQKIKFLITDFFSKCDETHRNLGIWSHLSWNYSSMNLLKKPFRGNLIFCPVS